MTRPSFRPWCRGLAGLPALALTVVAVATPAHAQAPMTLPEAAAAALRTHPSVAGAEARTAAAKADLDRARADRLPGARLEANLTRFQEPMIVAPLHSLDLMNAPTFDETLVQGRLGLSYTLFDGGARGARIDAAAAGADGVSRSAEVTEMELLTEVTAAYVGLVATRALRDAAAQQVEALEAELDRAEGQSVAGTAARVQVSRARASLQDAVAQLTSVESRVGLAERDLARLTGVDPAGLTGRPLADVSPADAGGVGAGTPPMIAAAARQVEVAEAGVAAERSTRLPRLDAGAALLDFGSLSHEHVLEWQAGLQLSWPIFTGGARGAGLRRAEARLREARAELASVRLRVARAEDAARTAVTEADARADALEAAVAQWREVVAIESLALEAGAGIQSDLLRASAALFQATAGLTRARSDAVLARVELARARGVLDLDWINEQLESR